MGAAEGSKRLVMDLINLWKIKKSANPALILKKLTDIYNVLEDVYSVEGAEELQSAIDQIGTGAGTIFIEAGTHEITVPIDIDNCGSIVIYGHGDNTILLPDDGITVFNITCCSSLLIKTLRIDTTNYTGATQAVIVNETNDNIVGFEDVSIGGVAAGFGICIELQSNNCYIDKCNLINTQQGIFVNNSENNMITNNIIGLHTQYGIYLDLGDSNTISGNSFVSNTIHGIYVHDSDYVILSHNGCFSNLQSGIYFDQASYNTISACICNTNFQNGIYIGNQSDYNTISSNNCNNNDSITANPQGGIVIADDSDFNTISANSCNNNNNTGAGDGYGILIHAATCSESMVAANNANGNDIDFQDSGTDTTIEYFVQDEFELQDAIDSIGSKSGIINIEGSFAITATIGIDDPAIHGGSYIIRGDGSNTTLTPSGDWSCFVVREARSVIFENFKIAATNLVGTTPAILINENSDNSIFINNVEIVGAGAAGYGIQIESPNCRIENCNINNVNIGIVPTDESCIITGNICNSNALYGIFLNTVNYITVLSNTCNLNQIGIYLISADGNLILGNTVKSNTADGIYLNTCDQNTLEGNIIDGNITTNVATDHAGITLNNGSLNNFILGNTIINNTNGGAGEGYGIYIVNAACLENIVRSNNISGNDIQWKDVGVNSDFEYRCSTENEITDAIASIAGKSGTIEILAGIISVSAQIAIDGGGSYTFKGTGASSILQLTAIGTHMFSITDALYVHFIDIRFDMTNHTGYAMPNRKGVIAINEIADNWVLIENCIFYYNGALADVAVPHGVLAWSNNITITNSFFYGLQSANYYDGSFCIISDCLIKCRFGTMFWTSSDHCIASGNSILVPFIGTNNSVGIHVSGAYHNIVGNNISNCGIDGIDLSAASYCLIDSNIIDTITSNLPTNRGGIYLTNNSDYNLISHNIIKGVINAGAGIGYGVVLFAAIEDVNYISHNIIIGCDSDTILNAGTGTIIFADDTVYGISWNGNLGTATKNAIYDKIQLVAAGGEVNTASNQGAGVGLFWQKLVADLQFNNLKSENNRLTVALDGVSHDVEFTIVEANIDHNALANYAANRHLLVGELDHNSLLNYDGLRHLLVGAIDHNSLLNYAANRHLLVGELDHNSLLNYAANQHFLENTINLANINEKNHASLANKNAEANIKHLTDAQLAALHTRLHWMNSGSDHVGNPWNIFYTRADGALIELALGVDDTVLTSTGAAAIPAFEPFNAKAVQAVEDAGLVLSAGKIIEYDGTPADGTYTGLVMLIDTTGCATFDAVYVDGINSVAKAQATGIATMPAIGVVVAAGKVLTHGAICSTASWAWAAGAVIYINETVAGELDDAIPALATELVQIMGVATGTDTIHVNPSLDWVVRV